MSGHCPRCGLYCEEDDFRLCSLCLSSSDRPDCDFNNNIPGGEWLEYDAAADWCAARGIRGGVRDPLPENLSDRAMEIINADTDAFERRVREHAYLRSMTGPRAVTIIKSDESHNQ
jgi:hypothetical protein